MRTYRKGNAVSAFSMLVLILSAVHQLAAQTIRGKLVDQYTNQPIPGATVSLVTAANAPVGRTVKTGNDGTFAIQAPSPGIYRLRADLAGYITAVTPAIELNSNDQINITWRLLAGTVSLRPVAIVSTSRRTAGRLGGFYDRMQRHGFGTFITSDQIEKTRPFTVSDLLRMVPGLEVLPSGRAFGNIVRTTEGCQPAIYLDGVRFPLMGESIDNIVNPMDLEGVEVYPHATEVPAEFATAGSDCGAILLWTKRS